MSVFTTKTAQLFVAAVAATFLLVDSTFAESHIVEIKSFQFTPSKLVIRPGDKVIWKNMDIVPHTATDINETWDTGHIDAGGTAELQFDGFFSGEYFCVYHPNMKAYLAMPR